MPCLQANKICCCAIAIAMLCKSALGGEPSAADAESFEKEIRPLLIRHGHRRHAKAFAPDWWLSLHVAGGGWRSDRDAVKGDYRARRGLMCDLDRRSH